MRRYTRTEDEEQEEEQAEDEDALYGFQFQSSSGGGKSYEISLYTTLAGDWKGKHFKGGWILNV